MIPTARTFFSCRAMRPDFKIRSTVDGLLMATWSEADWLEYHLTDEDRMTLIGRCYDEIVARERERESG